MSATSPTTKPPLPDMKLSPAQPIPSLSDKDLTLPLSAIKIDGGTQTRAGLNEEDIADYAEKMRAGANFPRVIVYHDGKVYWMADGFHRYWAAQRAGLTQIAATVKRGGQREALLY